MALPKKLGRFTVEKLIGQGAVGHIYKGLDPKIQRPVALKTLKFDKLASGDDATASKERFLVEARATGQLGHPNILTIYDAGEEKDMAFIAMEFIPGGDLQKMIEKGKFNSYNHIFDIVSKVADGLHHAHQKNIIHRDIKPANIMMADAKTPKIADFGLARLADSTLTATGTVLGTPSHMAPEQVRGRKIDGRADLFALGTILYEMLTGEKSFTGESITSVIYRVVNEDPTPPRELVPDLPRGIDAFIKKALAKEPDNRFQTGEEFAAALKDVAAGKGGGSAMASAATQAAKAGAGGVAKGVSGIAKGIGSITITGAKTVKNLAVAGVEGLKDKEKRAKTIGIMVVGIAIAISAVIYFSAETPKNKKAEEPSIETTKVSAKVSKRTALLSVITKPRGATITVKGRVMGKTPYLKRRYKKRKFRLTIAKKGYNDWSGIINLKKDRVVRVTLKKGKSATLEAGFFTEMFDPKADKNKKAEKPSTETTKVLSRTALLSVITKPRGATIAVKGRVMGKTPYIKHRYKKKKFRLTIAKKGYDDWSGIINLKKNRVIRMTLKKGRSATLEAGFFTKMFDPKAAGYKGSLIVKAKKGDKVTIDGKNYRGGLITIQETRTGPHTIFIKRKGYQPFQKTAKVNKGRTTTIVPRFKR